MKLVVSICTQAKTATMTRRGVTPERAVFGRVLCWPCAASTVDEDEITLAALGTDGEAWLVAQICAAARMALLSRDASDKMLRATPWSPQPVKGRQRQDALRWRGLATVIARESVGRYIGWRSRVLLVAKDQIRLATMEEVVASYSIAKVMAMTDSG